MEENIELCYFRLEKDKYINVHDAKEKIVGKDFNFSSKYKIKYINKNLKIEENKNYIPNFYNINTNNISNITAVIGKNGSGKTTLLDMITKILCVGPFGEYNFIIAFIKNNEIYVYAKEGLINKKIEHDFKLITFENQNIKESICKDMIKNTSIVFFSNIVNLRNKQINSSIMKNNFFNISIEEDINKTYIEPDIELNRKYVNQKFVDQRFVDNRVNREIKNKMTERNIKFLSQNNSILKVENISLYFKCYQKLGVFTSSLDKLRYYRKNNPVKRSDNYIDKLNYSVTKKEKEIYEEIEREILDSHSNRRRTVLYIAYFILIDKFFEELYNKINNNDIINLINNEIKKKVKRSRAIEMIYQVIAIIKNIEIDKIKTIYQRSIDSEDSITDIVNEFKKFLQEICKKYERTLTNLNNIIRNAKIMVEAIRPYEKEKMQSSKVLRQIIPIISVPNEEIKKLYKILNSDNNFIEMFNLEFKGLSSGQQALLNLYSSFYDVLDKIKKQKNVLILMDEPELYFHPEWQRKYIYFIVEFFNTYYKEKNVQIIFTSNSPYVLSDLNNSSVIMLEKEQENETFAGNIINLLIDNYFMEDTIGKFSEEKIKEIVKRVKNNEVNRDDIKVINQIGEDIIRKNIEEMIKKYDKNTTTKK
ncbi:MAG: AAA family ATPase [Clostridia bacterium]